MPATVEAVTGKPSDCGGIIIDDPKLLGQPMDHARRMDSSGRTSDINNAAAGMDEWVVWLLRGLDIWRTRHNGGRAASIEQIARFTLCAARSAGPWPMPDDQQAKNAAAYEAMERHGNAWTAAIELETTPDIVRLRASRFRAMINPKGDHH